MYEPKTIVVIVAIIAIIISIVIIVVSMKSACSEETFINLQHRFIEKFEQFKNPKSSENTIAYSDRETAKPLYSFEIPSSTTPVTYTPIENNAAGQILNPKVYLETYNNLLMKTSSIETFSTAIKSRKWGIGALKNLNKELFTAYDKQSIKQLISHVLYINLPHRTDRNSSTIDELTMLGLPFSRILGEKSSFGGLGCSKAHLKALKHAKEEGYPTVLICEDDLEFKFSAAKIYKFLMQALESIDSNWDVILLSGGKVKSSFAGKHIKRVTAAQTRTAYVVKESYYDTLINNFSDNVQELTTRGPTSYSKGFAGDQYWKRLQPLDNWYIISPKLCRQRQSYSDIQKRVADYGEESFR